jgi:hypothetical protein
VPLIEQGRLGEGPFKLAEAPKERQPLKQAGSRFRPGDGWRRCRSSAPPAKRHQDDRRRARPHGIEADDGLREWVDYGDARMSGGAPYGWIERTEESWLDEDNDHPQPEEQFIDPAF